MYTKQSPVEFSHKEGSHEWSPRYMVDTSDTFYEFKYGSLKGHKH